MYRQDWKRKLLLGIEFYMIWGDFSILYIYANRNRVRDRELRVGISRIAADLALFNA